MFRILLILSLIPIVAALLARWWFGLRVLASEGSRTCRCDLGKWMPAPGDEAVVYRSEKSAAEFGAELRAKALIEWREQEPKAAVARENSRRFGQAVPPLSAVIAALALLAGRVPLMGAVAIVFAASALAAVFGLLSLPHELRAITRHAAWMRKNQSFPTSDDGETVIRCAIAHAWSESLPLILRWLQR